MAELLDLLDRYGEDARILAGGQSLIPSLNMRLSSPSVLIDINGLTALAGIRADAHGVTIGALTRHRDLERDAAVAERLPLLHQAMPHVAHVAVRNRGTFGGSIVFADPAAELPACAIALDATFTVRGKQGERIVRAREFFSRLYETALAPGEVLTEARFPARGSGYRSVFQELARRHGDYAIVGLAAHAKVDDGMLTDVSLAFLGAGETPVLARGAAAALDGVAYTPAALADAQAALASDLAPFNDAVTSAATRMHLARVLLARAAAQLTGSLN